MQASDTLAHLEVRQTSGGEPGSEPLKLVDGSPGGGNDGNAGAVASGERRSSGGLGGGGVGAGAGAGAGADSIVQGGGIREDGGRSNVCLLYTSPSPRDQRGSRMPSSA